MDAIILPTARPIQMPIKPQFNTIPKRYVQLTVKINSLMIVQAKLVDPRPIP